uniref:F-box domain-containing protein n=1 Tax=Acrobeloides nanus TaxID=290746 RepID=A0A914C0H5_9BILA
MEELNAKQQTLKTEETVLRATLAQRPPLPSSPPPTVYTLPVKRSSSTRLSENSDDLCTPSTSNGNEGNQTVKFERKSSSPCINSSSQEKNPFDDLPWHLLSQIFCTLELKERVIASQVCRRWYSLLTDGRCPLEDVVVLNIFERHVWKSTVSKNAGSKVQCIELIDNTYLKNIFAHCPAVNSVKVWYSKREFAQTVLEKLKECEVKMRCIDIFPYSADVSIELFHEYLPNLTGITMRPHGTDYFWSGLNLNTFPAFEKLDTLILDSFNLAGDVELPESITTLEWHNRREGSFADLRARLKKLKRLEYLQVGHADFSNDDFIKFVDAVHVSNLPKLQYLMFRFCKFSSSIKKLYLVDDSELPQSQALDRLQFLKLDLCSGSLPAIVQDFLFVTGKNLKIMSLNVISDESRSLFTQIYDNITDELNARNVSLHLGLLQKEKLKSWNVTSSENQQRPEETPYPTPPKNFANILWKFEASFVEDFPLLRSIFMGTTYPFLSELKFIQCSSIQDEILEAIALNCPRLKKLSLLSCNEQSTHVGILPFVKQCRQRLSKSLQIIWKRDTRRYSRPAAFFLSLMNDHADLIKGLRARFYCKQFSDHNR